MSQHVPVACSESDGLWLPLTEYAVKSGMSLSTIRRKIKSNSLLYRLEKGRYLIFFSDPDGKPSIQTIKSSNVSSFNKLGEANAEPTLTASIIKTKDPDIVSEERLSIPFVEKAVNMVSQAFEHALREKDARIKLLEKRNEELGERLSELRTLVKALEEKYEVHY